MSIWERIGEFAARLTGGALAGVIEAVRTLFEGDPVTRRRVAFSVAMIALSAKMAKADGIVTPSEVQAFREVFEVPAEEVANVARLYDLAKGDVAGFETYAARMAQLCEASEPGCAILEDIIDGLFHIAKADGVLHDQELVFLRRIGEIFGFDPVQFNRILARHASEGEADPYLVLGLAPGATFAEVRKQYRALIAENHPDRLIARGVPEEFQAIANARMAAINAAYALLAARLRKR